jgi:hypothetical protein
MNEHEHRSGAGYPFSGSGLAVLAALAVANLVPVVHYAVGPWAAHILGWAVHRHAAELGWS